MVDEATFFVLFFLAMTVLTHVVDDARDAYLLLRDCTFSVRCRGLSCTSEHSVLVRDRVHERSPLLLSTQRDLRIFVAHVLNEKCRLLEERELRTLDGTAQSIQ